jgi:hypothetical protein
LELVCNRIAPVDVEKQARRKRAVVVVINQQKKKWRVIEWHEW